MQLKSGLLGLVCFAVLCITLSLGLWPFHSPKNDVTWLKNANGVSFGRYGVVVSSDVLKPPASHQNEGGTVELWVRPDRWSNSATLVSLYRPESRTQFAMRQSLTDLEVAGESTTFSGRDVTNHFYVNDALGAALRGKQPIFLTVACGKQGTRVYLDGVLVKTLPQFHVDPKAFAGRVILGQGPWQPDSFRGEVRGLAIFEAELGSDRILQHYRTWTEAGQPDIVADDQSLALYLFNEHTGGVIHSHSEAAGTDLYIPVAYEVIDKIALEPFWREFDFSRSYWSGNVKNIIGFIPFGFCFYAWFSMTRRRSSVTFFTLVLGALVSLTIEVVQALLPTRDSGTTDIITNIIGTWVGVLCCKKAYPVIARMFASRGWLSQSKC